LLLSIWALPAPVGRLLLVLAPAPGSRAARAAGRAAGRSWPRALQGGRHGGRAQQEEGAAGWRVLLEGGQVGRRSRPGRDCGRAKQEERRPAAGWRGWRPGAQIHAGGEGLEGEKRRVSR